MIAINLFYLNWQNEKGIKETGFIKISENNFKSQKPKEKMQTELNYQELLQNLTTSGTLPTEQEMEQICLEATKVFTALPNVLEISSPVNIFGNIAAQFSDLTRAVTQVAKNPEQGTLLFLGNYVNRSTESLACISYLFLRVLIEPERVYLLRGNHEAKEITKVYGLYEETMTHYGNENVWNYLCSAFNHLPLAAVINKKVFAVHGGLSPDLGTIEELNQVERRQAVAHQGLITDLLWSDPADQDGYNKSPRGAGCIFGQAQTEEFLSKNGLDYIIRSHQLPQNELGYIKDHGDKCITVWNATHYCGKMNNKSSVGYIGEDQELELLVFEKEQQ